MSIMVLLSHNSSHSFTISRELMTIRSYYFNVKIIILHINITYLISFINLFFTLWVLVSKTCYFFNFDNLTRTVPVKKLLISIFFAIYHIFLYYFYRIWNGWGYFMSFTYIFNPSHQFMSIIYKLNSTIIYHQWSPYSIQ